MMDPLPTMRPTSARSQSSARPTSARCATTSRHHQHGNNDHHHHNQPDMLGAKAALSALQHGVVGERSSTGMALEKQLAVGSDVRSFAVVGSDVWMAHSDGNLSIRDCRTGHLVEPTPQPLVYRSQPQQASSLSSSSCGAASSDRLLGATPSPWCLLAVAPIASSLSSSTSSAVTLKSHTVWVGFADGNIEVFDSETRDSLGVVPRHHSGGVYCLANFSNTVFSGSNDFQIGMWDAVTRSYLRQFSGHTNYVRCLHAEGALLFSGSDDASVRVWNVTNGSEISRASFHRKSGVSCLIRVGPNMWSGDNNGDIIVWRLQTMREEHLLKEHTGRITALKKVGRSRVYSAAADRLICVWDAFQHALLHRVAEHNSWVLSLCFPCSLTRHYVWTGAADATVRCFHHDEFVPMTQALETSLEGAWYSSDYAPYRDLSESQADEIKALRSKLQLLHDSERLARERAGHLEMHLDRARSEITEVDSRNHRELEEVAVLKKRFANFDQREREILQALARAEQDREEMRKQLLATQEDNQRLVAEVQAVTERCESARFQSEHMESLLRQAVKAQEAARAAMNPAASASSSGGAAGNRASPRGGRPVSPRGGGGMTAAGSTFSAGGGAAGRYFSGGQRPLILVTMSSEHAKIVSDLEAEIAELNEKITRLQRVHSARGRTTSALAAAAASGGAGKAGAPKSAAAAAMQQQRDWTHQAADILSARQAQKDLVAMAAAIGQRQDEQQQQQQQQARVPHPPPPPQPGPDW